MIKPMILNSNKTSKSQTNPKQKIQIKEKIRIPQIRLITRAQRETRDKQIIRTAVRKPILMLSNRIMAIQRIQMTRTLIMILAKVAPRTGTRPNKATSCRGMSAAVLFLAAYSVVSAAHSWMSRFALGARVVYLFTKDTATVASSRVATPALKMSRTNVKHASQVICSSPRAARRAISHSTRPRHLAWAHAQSTSTELAMAASLVWPTARRSSRVRSCRTILKSSTTSA